MYYLIILKKKNSPAAKCGAFFSDSLIVKSRFICDGKEHNFSLFIDQTN